MGSNVPPHRILIDAGVGGIRIQTRLPAQPVTTRTLRGNEFLNMVTGEWTTHINEGSSEQQFYITGKLAQTVRDRLGRGIVLLPDAVIWAAAQVVMEERNYHSLAVIELSASGYRVIGIDRTGRLVDDLLVSNPRCGAGAGINLDRVLQKLAIPHAEVDILLADLLGDAGKEAREAVLVRADRCGVFSVSATISDKNQGIPLHTALAVTLKSEVLKVCNKIRGGFDGAILSGGIFRWRYARDCARDYLSTQGITAIEHDRENDLVFRGIERLTRRIGKHFIQPPTITADKRHPKGMQPTLPSLGELRHRYMRSGLYQRQPDQPPDSAQPLIVHQPILLALDVGSTMAKVVIATAPDARPLRYLSYSNHGDTIETVKQIFRDLTIKGIDRVHLQGIGITGSARYQVRQVLQRVYPALEGRISVWVENVAHARGSIEVARTAVDELSRRGHRVNQETFVVVDIGGEDTKISRVSLRRGDLIDNAMNVKCSAGTGSLMDTLAAMFEIDDIGSAYAQALAAPRSFPINATCAVFLMENVRKLQVQGACTAEILASATWAIVENMARSLWNRLELPANTLVMLHGQPMRSDALPLAVSHRLQSFVNDRVYCRVPEQPGHRACLGLLRTLTEQGLMNAVTCDPAFLIAQDFGRRIVQCRGAACGDKEARCNRVVLKSTDSKEKTFKVTLGGCSSINEWQQRKQGKPAQDIYKRLWHFIDDRQPRSEDPQRLVIPRSFAVSEWAALIAQIFIELGLPVHVDNIQPDDIVNAQGDFAIDTCAPHIGAVGQYKRLAQQPHGAILAPQLEFLPTRAHSLGRTCTLNQGGVETARNLAHNSFPNAHFVPIKIDLKRLQARPIARQLTPALPELFPHQATQPTMEMLTNAVTRAIAVHASMRDEIQNEAADLIEEALADGRRLALVAGREYILNPGIYDSHIGQLLRDKGIAAIPAHLLDLEPNPEFSHIYWRNPQLIVTLIAATNRRTLHQHLHHPRLRRLFQALELHAAIPLVQVTTFRCGPDSIVAPLIAELTRERPPLLIQSDAVIQELAHLESRVDTYVKQLDLTQPATATGQVASFSVELLERFEQLQAINPERDILYLPTVGDNRALSAVIRAAGISCMDNFSEEEYDLEGIIRDGRSHAGDAVCSPLAAVYGDVRRAMADVQRRKAANDPLVDRKQRLLVANIAGTGPCRQGQYCHVHKTLFWRELRAEETREDKPEPQQEMVLQFLLGKEGDGYDIGLPEWARLRIFQAIVLHGVLDSIHFAGSARCRTAATYKKFEQAHRELKRACFHIMEHKTRPSAAAQRLVAGKAGRTVPAALVKYFAYGLHRGDLQRELRRFAGRWIQPLTLQPGLFKIHIEGEAYLRNAQAPSIHRALLDALGHGRFALSYSPTWSYLEYLVAIDALRGAMQADEYATDKAANLQQEIRQARRGHRQGKVIITMLRRVIAAPLYRAAGLPLPEPMFDVLQTAKQILPSLHPEGELAPYVGEALIHLWKGTDLFLNVAPEGCMVASMSETLTPRIMAACPNARGRIQHFFSSDGEVDEERLVTALLKGMGPHGYYGE